MLYCVAKSHSRVISSAASWKKKNTCSITLAEKYAATVNPEYVPPWNILTLKLCFNIYGWLHNHTHCGWKRSQTTSQTTINFHSHFKSNCLHTKCCLVTLSCSELGWCVHHSCAECDSAPSPKHPSLKQNSMLSLKLYQWLLILCLAIQSVAYFSHTFQHKCWVQHKDVSLCCCQKQ